MAFAGVDIEVNENELDAQLHDDAISSIIREQDEFNAEIMKHKIEIIRKEAESNQIENKTIIIGLKEEISKYQTEIENLTKNNNDLILRANDAHEKEALVSAEYRNLEQRLFSELGVNSIEECFDALNHFNRYRKELENSKVVIQQLQLELSDTRNKSKFQIEPKRAEMSELAHKMQLNSEKIVEYESQIQYKTEENINLQKEIMALKTQNKSLSDANTVLSEQCKLLKSKQNEVEVQNQELNSEIQNLNNKINELVKQHAGENNQQKLKSLNETRRLKLLSELGDRFDPRFAALEVTSPVYDIFRKLSSFMKVSTNVDIGYDIVQNSFIDVSSEINGLSDKFRGGQRSFTPNIQQLLDAIEAKNKEISDLKDENEELKSKSDFLELNDKSPQFAAALKKIERLETENRSLSLMNESLRSVSLSPRSQNHSGLF